MRQTAGKGQTGVFMKTRRFTRGRLAHLTILRFAFLPVIFLALCAMLARPVAAQTFQSGTIMVATGNDDLRAGSSAQVEFMRGDEVLGRVTLTGDRERFADNTTKTVHFNLDAPLEISRVEFIQLVYFADRDFWGYDEWNPNSLIVHVNSSSFDPVRLLETRRVPEMTRERTRWRSGVLETFGRTQTRIAFRVGTGNDDLRQGSQAVCEVETDDGRVFSTGIYGLQRDRTTASAHVDLPSGITSDNIRLARLRFTQGSPGFHSMISAMWQGDQWEVARYTVRAIEPDGRTVDIAVSGRIKFEQPGWWQSAPRMAQRAPFAGANRFVVFVYTGNDDLRTDPNVQPNSEIDVRVNLRGGRSVLLDTGRSVRRHFVGTTNTAFFGTFKDWGMAWAVARTSENIPFDQIENFSVTMVRGRSRDIPRGTIVGETADPFRGDDEWKLHGLWIGVGPGGRITGEHSHWQNLSSQSHRIFSQWNIGAKLNRNNLTFTTASFGPLR
jgi:hypothetical protein